MKFTGADIGRGAYGIFEVEYGGAPCVAREVASSLQSVSKGDDKVLQDSFLSKCHTWSRLHHPYIVQFIGVVKVIVHVLLKPLYLPLHV